MNITEKLGLPADASPEQVAEALIKFLSGGGKDAALEAVTEESKRLAARVEELEKALDLALDLAGKLSRRLDVDERFMLHIVGSLEALDLLEAMGTGKPSMIPRELSAAHQALMDAIEQLRQTFAGFPLSNGAGDVIRERHRRARRDRMRRVEEAQPVV